MFWRNCGSRLRRTNWHELPAFRREPSNWPFGDTGIVHPVNSFGCVAWKQCAGSFSVPGRTLIFQTSRWILASSSTAISHVITASISASGHPILCATPLAGPYPRVTREINNGLLSEIGLGLLDAGIPGAGIPLFPRFLSSERSFRIAWIAAALGSFARRSGFAFTASESDYRD